MWNKSQSEPEDFVAKPEPTPNRAPAPPPDRQAVLGPSITIKGTLSGQEDFLIEGRVQGEVSFKQHVVTVGKRGRVDADLYCKRIFVEGEVQGNLFGEELVVIRSSGKVKGNATAPRVSIEDGAQFRGAVDMQPNADKQNIAAAVRQRKEQKEAASNANTDPAETPEQQRASGIKAG